MSVIDIPNFRKWHCGKLNPLLNAGFDPGQLQSEVLLNVKGPFVLFFCTGKKIVMYHTVGP